MGQFDYGQPHSISDHIQTIILEADNDGWIYIGEVKEEAHDTPHGMGIKVWDNGSIQEGYWKDGKLHGRVRGIFWDGYCIWEYTEGNWNRHGIVYNSNGNRYEGGWRNGIKYGQGTLYVRDGDIFDGEWDGSKGQGEISYSDGKMYIGQWDWKSGGLKRHGFGTLLSADGKVIKEGMWKRDEYSSKKK